MLSFIDNGVTLLPVLKELLGDAAERLLLDLRCRWKM